MEVNTALLLLSFFLWTCSNASGEQATASRTDEDDSIVLKDYQVDPDGMTIALRFPPPEGTERIAIEATSFAAYLRQLPLKPHGTEVYLYDGTKKRNQFAAAAVIDLDVGKRDLQQCADAVIRMRAEYLWQKQAYDEIEFNFTNGFPASYRKWRNGQRIRVAGNEVRWTASSSSDTSYSAFRKYLDMVFAYAGTLSVERELQARPLAEIEIGDVFIQGGSPGHAVIVVDMVVDTGTGEKSILLAQSYMPAQDIHVLTRPAALSPWYPVSGMEETFRTPEWTFKGGDLRKF